VINEVLEYRVINVCITYVPLALSKCSSIQRSIRKSKYTLKNMLANRKSKNMPNQEEEDSSDDEYLDYDNLHLSFDPEKCQKFHC
jgi:hypothetical protein